MQQPQTCTKCNILPEDILMLACKHDLCLNCAADRLSFEMKKKKPANSIVCEFCYERTPLDADSVNELEKLITVTKVRKPFEQSKYDSKVYTPLQSSKVDVQSKPRLRDYPPPTTKEMAKKSCIEHPEEDILYFCFDCKCECICPECIIHGKHKEHDVKTIKKAAPIIKNELDANLDRVDASISSLILRKNEIEKVIRALTEQTNNNKRQIQSAFDEVRGKIDAQEKELLLRCDGSLNESLNQLEKTTKNILRRVDELKMYTSSTSEYLKKDEILMLNFYSKKWREMGDEEKNNHINVPSVAVLNNEKIIASILDVGDVIDKISLERRITRTDHQ